MSAAVAPPSGAAIERAAVVVIRHPRHVVLFAFVGGLLAAPLPPLVGPGAAILTAVAVALAACCRSTPPPAQPVNALALAAAAAVVAGSVLGTARLAALDGERLLALRGEPVGAVAELLEPVRVREHGADVRARLRDGPAAGEHAVLHLPRSLRLRPGARVRVVGRVVALQEWESFQRRRGAAAAIDVDVITPTGARRGGLSGWLDRVRVRAEAGLAAGLALREESLARGMILGQDERLTEAVRDDFRRSGLAHLLAVSGQNVMLLAALVMAGGYAVAAPIRARWLAALALIALYVPLAGAGPSIQRAGVMGAAGLVAALAGTPSSRCYALGLAAAVTLALNPLASGDPGWQLSFAAVAGLMALAPRLRALLERRALPRPVAEAAAMTIAATLATAPLMALHFEQVSLASLPANLAAAPAVAPVMWLGMLASAVAQLDPLLALPLNALNAPLLAYLQAVAQVAADLPAASVGVRLTLPLAAATVAVGSAAWLARHRLARAAAAARTGVTRRAAAAGAALLAVALAAAALTWPRAAAPPDPRELVVSFLDVGQGDATLLQHRGAALLFDTGPPGGPIVARLREAGVARLDALVITHAQADHEGAAAAILATVPTRAILNAGAGWRTPVQRLLARDRRVREVAAGQRLRVAGLDVRFLWPPPRPRSFLPDGDPNARALVAHVRRGEFDLLLPADAESDVTAALDLPQVEALKVAHHGSEDPGLPALLARLRPRIAAIEVGEGNDYGHPRRQALQALRAVPQVFRTDVHGTIRLRVGAAGIRVSHD